MTPEELRSRVRQWIEGDPDPITRRELESLLEAESWEELGERFSSSLSFGTAGLRGVDGGGPNRMNVAVVTRASYGLARYLARRELEGPVIVGRDARTRSADYFTATAGVLSAAGFEVLTFPEPVPTPLVAFACREIGAAAGVVITASHNPPEYNGYKVYNEFGAQIIPPADDMIAHEISLAPPAAKIDVDDSRVQSVAPDLREKYIRTVIRPAQPPQRIAYTALHGVGGPTTA